jgi:chloramphenicol 3-O phosphotransferase
MIIILNGTSSSGKTSVLKSIQEQSEDVFIEFGLDKVIFMMPGRYIYTSLWNEILGEAYRAGEYGKKLMKAMHHAALSLHHNSINIIMDHVLVEDEWKKECADLYAGEDVYIIGIKCPLHVLEEREKMRKDRTLGQAGKQYDIVHKDCIYDLEIDTSILSLNECAKLILEHIKNTKPRGLKAMKAGYCR